jgi:hypothetical protein
MSAFAGYFFMVLVAVGNGAARILAPLYRHHALEQLLEGMDFSRWTFCASGTLAKSRRRKLGR